MTLSPGGDGPGPGPQARPSRRRLVLGALGAGVAGPAAVAGLTSCTGRAESASVARRITVADWVGERGDRFLVAHRGSGDVLPEHTLEAYEAALGWGARAMEISVVRSKDGVLYCHHDLTLDRTTTLTGPVSARTSAELDAARVSVPRLGPGWQGDARPHLPRFADVLDRVGGRAVLAVESKDDAAHDDMLGLVADRGLDDTILVKTTVGSERAKRAHRAGLPVFGYLGRADLVTAQGLKTARETLDPATDCLVIPAQDYRRPGNTPLAEDLVTAAVATGVPVWAFPVHRRSEAERLWGLGVRGLVTSSYGYVARTAPVLREAAWGSGRIGAGEMTREPQGGPYDLTWPEPGVVRLGAQGVQSFLTLGQLAGFGLPGGPERLDLEVRVDVAPSSSWTLFSIAFGHADDAYYEHRLGQADGYHASLRMNGTLLLHRHHAGSTEGELLRDVSAPAPTVGTWVPLHLSFHSGALALSRSDTGTLVTTSVQPLAGGVVHIGRSGTDGQISVRGLRLS